MASISAFGLSCCNMGSVIPIQTYFNKHRALAQSIVVSAYGLAQFAWPPFAEWLLREYALTGTLIIFAGIQLQGCVFGSMLRPFQATPKLEKDDKNTKDVEQEATNIDQGVFSISDNMAAFSENSENVHKNKDFDVKWDQQKHAEPNKHIRIPSKNMEGKNSQTSASNTFDLFRNWNFMLYLFGVFLGFIGTQINFLYLPKIGVNHGFDPQRGAFLVSILSKYYQTIFQ